MFNYAQQLFMVQTFTNFTFSLFAKFTDSPKEPCCPERPEGRQLERWLLLKPAELVGQEVYRVTLHGTQLIQNFAVRWARSWAVTQERVTVNI